MAKSLEVQALQLAKISVGLENVANALARAQRDGAVLISTVEGRLLQIDNQVGQLAPVYSRRSMRILQLSSRRRSTTPKPFWHSFIRCAAAMRAFCRTP